ncbi:hypothetical protein [Acinetobacter bereziniae]|uniref:hypothetical protein n=1 Tax=Acinetobacter bereziniae TaxID=106648 RepID=UPI00300A5886
MLNTVIIFLVLGILFAVGMFFNFRELFKKISDEGLISDRKITGDNSLIEKISGYEEAIASYTEKIARYEKDIAIYTEKISGYEKDLATYSDQIINYSDTLHFIELLRVYSSHDLITEKLLNIRVSKSSITNRWFNTIVNPTELDQFYIFNNQYREKSNSLINETVESKNQIDNSVSKFKLVSKAYPQNGYSLNRLGV